MRRARSSDARTGSRDGLICINAALPHWPILILCFRLACDMERDAMSANDRANTFRATGFISARIKRIGLDPARLKPAQLAKFHEIQRGCPACSDPARCAAGLAFAVPKEDLEEWDDYCPSAARLRILAAFTMFQPEDKAWDAAGHAMQAAGAATPQAAELRPNPK